MKYFVFVGRVAFHETKEISRRRCAVVAHYVRAASHNDGKVAGRKFNGFRHSAHLEPGTSANDNVKDSRLGRSTNADAPWRSELRPEVNSASKAYPAQEIGEKRFAPGVGGITHTALPYLSTCASLRFFHIFANAISKKNEQERK
jgi:hypothetical protein